MNTWAEKQVPHVSITVTNKIHWVNEKLRLQSSSDWQQGQLVARPVPEGGSHLLEPLTAPSLHVVPLWYPRAVRVGSLLPQRITYLSSLGGGGMCLTPLKLSADFLQRLLSWWTQYEDHVRGKEFLGTLPMLGGQRHAIQPAILTGWHLRFLMSEILAFQRSVVC